MFHTFFTYFFQHEDSLFFYKKVLFFESILINRSIITWSITFYFLSIICVFSSCRIIVFGNFSLSLLLILLLFVNIKNIKFFFLKRLALYYLKETFLLFSFNLMICFSIWYVSIQEISIFLFFLLIYCKPQMGLDLFFFQFSLSSFFFCMLVIYQYN